eukprot:g2069.t1
MNIHNMRFLLVCCLAWPVLLIHASHDAYKDEKSLKSLEEDVRKENAQLLLENKRMASFLSVAETISSQYVRSRYGFEVAPLCNGKGMCESKENPELRVKCEDTEFIRFCLETCRDSFVRCAKVGQVAPAHSKTARYGMRISENPGKLTPCEIAANAGLPLPKKCPQDKSVYTPKKKETGKPSRKIAQTSKKKLPKKQKQKKQRQLLPPKVSKSTPPKVNKVSKKVKPQRAKRKSNNLQVVADNTQDQQDTRPEEDVIHSPDQEGQDSSKPKSKADSGIDVVKAESDRNSNVAEQGKRLESEQTVDGKSVESPGSRPI